MIHILPIITAFFATLIFIKVFYDIAIKINFVDVPNIRKIHIGVVPLVGGIAVVFGFTLACLLSPRSLSEWRPLFLCIMPLAVIGILDDHGDISINKRLIMQLISCLVMIYHGNVYISNVGDIFGLNYSIKLEYAGSFITIICVIGVINSLNLIDGIDGLCASVSLISLVGIVFLVLYTGATASISLILYFGSALFAFLLVNLNLTSNYIKKVFLGDTGTTIIGFFLCWHLIRLSNGDNALIRPITAVWLLALPIIDTLAVMIRRIRSKQSPFRPGRDHIHHQLLNIGLSSRSTLLILVSCSMLLVGIGVMSEVKDVPEPFMFYGILILFVLYYAGSEKLSSHSKSKHLNI